MKHFLTISIAAVLCIALSGCKADAVFDGKKFSNDSSFQMDYSVLDQQETSSLTLSEGDSLLVSITQETGTVGVTVGIDGKEPIYEGSGLTDANFSLNIQESGTYEIAVTGRNACGRVAFTKAEAKPSSETNSLNKSNQSAGYAAYQLALQQIAFDHIYPDGTNTGFDWISGFGDMEDNHFAIFDINHDGIDELIVQFVTAPMAGNAETIYVYNEKENALENILTLFPAVAYYDNGIIKEKWSHSSGLEGEDYWPYNLYQYHADTGEYSLIAEVNMWSKSSDLVDYKGDPYPESIDEEKAGVVFILTRNGVTETVSKSDYEAWLSAVVENAQPIQIPYLPLNEENIQAVYD